jgi:hypothetical protein
MKATTFVVRQHQRLREMVRLLEADRHARTPLLAEVVEEILSFVALEEDLFYPSVAALIGRDLAMIQDEIARLEHALLDLLRADHDDLFAERVQTLDRLLDVHARNDTAILPLAERALSEPQLEELGLRMARLSKASGGSPRGTSGSEDPGTVTFH